MRIKDYLSYSQYSIFNSSRDQYIKIYINGDELNNKYLDFGKKIAKGLEHRNIDYKDEDIDLARKLITPAKQKEIEIRANFDKVPLLGILDGFYKNKDKAIIDEYKTGTSKWTQKLVDNNEQLTIYAILVWLKYDINPENIEIKLHWLPTYKDIDNSIHLTEEIKTFKTKRTMKDFINIYPKLKKTWLGIEELINSLM